MPAQKRPYNQPSPDSPASKRHAAGYSNDDIIKLLKECSQKQQKYISQMEQFLQSHKCRFQRLRRHLHYHLIIEMKRGSVRNSIEKQIEEYEKELGGLHPKEAMLKLTVKEMSEQEDKLEKIVRDVVKHKGYMLQYAKKMVHSEPNKYGPYKEELTNALQRVPTINRDDAGMTDLPKLTENDLDDVEWPETIYNWSEYSIHWNSEFEEATVCRSLNEKIKILNEQLEEEASDYKEVQTRKYTIELYDVNRNCLIHADRIRNFERTARTEQLERLIHKIFEKKASIERLKAEEKILRSHSLCHLHATVQGSYLPLSLDMPPMPCPIGQGAHQLGPHAVDQGGSRTATKSGGGCSSSSSNRSCSMALGTQRGSGAYTPGRKSAERDHRRRLENLRAPVAPRPVVPPPRPWDPLVDPLAPAPGVPFDREPDQEPNVMPNMDDILVEHRLVMEQRRRVMEDINNRMRAAAARWDQMALAPVPPPPMPPPPMALLPNPVFPPPQWQPGPFANLFAAVLAPPPPPPAPARQEAPHAAPQADDIDWMGADRNMDEDEEEDWDSDDEDDDEDDWRSDDEDDDEEDDEEEEDEPEDDLAREAPAAPAPQAAPVQWQPGQYARMFPGYWAPQEPRVSPVPGPDGDSDDEDGGENDEDSDEDSDEDEEDNWEDDVDSGEEDAAPAVAPAPAPQAAPVDGDDLEILEVRLRASPQVRQPAVQIEEGVEYVVLD
ncbi:hypothetical protein CAEBREN_23697 [Caenorhabditis brenneri]|uniref:Uncharacterized protein n=1 Tax=Caenorhabditis brenneri TaxID=135651 RepID=G0NIW1_CAEBE|nr:hypothetical protein CAEBREN_23697 [Caenorhabditis brenneri]